jgi:riboflavin biosynthesis pyrimidine reductase
LEVSGPNLAAAFIETGLIDEIRRLHQSDRCGRRQTLLGHARWPLELRFLGLQTFEGGVVHLCYAVQAQPGASVH